MMKWVDRSVWAVTNSHPACIASSLAIAHAAVTLMLQVIQWEGWWLLLAAAESERLCTFRGLIYHVLVNFFLFSSSLKKKSGGWGDKSETPGVTTWNVDIFIQVTMDLVSVPSALFGLSKWAVAAQFTHQNFMDSCSPVISRDCWTSALYFIVSEHPPGMQVLTSMV